MLLRGTKNYENLCWKCISLKFVTLTQTRATFYIKHPSKEIQTFSHKLNALQFYAQGENMNKTKSIWLIAAVIGLLIVSAFCVLTVIGIVNLVNSETGFSQIFNPNTERAIINETLTISPEDLTTLVFNLDYSDIQVIESEDDEIVLELEKIAWGATQEEAEARAEALTLDQSTQGSKLTFTIPHTPTQEFNTIINIILHAPKDMELSLSTISGEVTVSNYQGSVDIDHNFGDITVTNFQGNLSINNDNGNITLKQLTLSQNFSLFTDFGEIKITDLTAADIEIENQNGSLVLTDIMADGECTFSSDFTDTEVENIECDTLTLESQNGTIELTHGQIDGDIQINTDFGDITLEDVTAENYSLTSNNGIIYADSLQGEVTINDQFGDIELYGSQNQITLDIESENGRIYFEGILNLENDHAISSEFGSIEVHIPSDSAFDIDFSTEFGEIESSLPVTISGKLDTTKMEGQINGGGSLLEITSYNGNITLNSLDK